MKTNILIAAAIAATLSLVSLNANAQRCATTNNPRGERTEMSSPKGGNHGNQHGNHQAQPAVHHAPKGVNHGGHCAPQHHCVPDCHAHGPHPAPAPVPNPAPVPAPHVVPAPAPHPAPAPARHSIDINIGKVTISVNS